MRSETFAARNAVAVTKLLSGKYFADIFVSGGLASATEGGVPHHVPGRGDVRVSLSESCCHHGHVSFSESLVPKALNGGGAAGSRSYTTISNGLRISAASSLRTMMLFYLHYLL